jgi:hypothetical protein
MEFRATVGRCARCGGDHRAEPVKNIVHAVLAKVVGTAPSPPHSHLADAIRNRRLGPDRPAALRAEPAPSPVAVNDAPEPPDLAAAIRATRGRTR